MFGFFSTKPREPKYTEEGKALYNLLQDKKKWKLVFEKSTDPFTTYKNKIYYACHQESDIWARSDGCSIYIKFTNSEICWTLFSIDDCNRIRPILSSLVQELKDKPFKDRLIKFGGSNCGAESETCEHVEED